MPTKEADGDVDDVGHGGQVVQPEPDGVGAEGAALGRQLGERMRLQIERARLAASAAGCPGRVLQPQRFAAREELRVHQRARLGQQDRHDGPSRVTADVFAPESPTRLALPPHPVAHLTDVGTDDLSARRGGPGASAAAPRAGPEMHRQQRCTHPSE